MNGTSVAHNGKTRFVTIDKKLVHKWNSENIFIADLYRRLPQFIPGPVFEQEVCPKLEREDCAFVNSLYTRFPFATDFPGRGEFYVLNSLIPVVPDRAKDRLELDANGEKLFGECYGQSPDGNSWVLRGELDEMAEHRLLELFDVRRQAIPFADRLRLSRIFEQMECIPKKDVFYTRMYVDPRHSYYFEHPNDHVPGMMEIEAIRQFAMAASHVFGNLPVSGSNIIISRLESTFNSFVELAYPITLQLEVVKLKVKHGHWVMTGMDLAVIQNNTVATSVYIEASAVDSNIFHRLRSDKGRLLERHRFYPVHADYRLCLYRDDPEEAIDVKLAEISTDGFLLEVDARHEAAVEDDCFNFSLVFGGFRGISGSGKLTREALTPDGLMAGFTIGNLSEDDASMLRVLIERNCKVVETPTAV